MEKTIFQTTKKIGIDKNGNGVFLKVEIREHNKTKETIRHEVVNHFYTLTISGFARRNKRCDFEYGGQIQDHITEDNIRRWIIDKEKVKRILEIWNQWHLNDTIPGCIHQGKPRKGKEWDVKEWERLTKKCPLGYQFGSKWLVDPLPIEIIEEVKSLFN